MVPGKMDRPVIIIRQDVWRRKPSSERRRIRDYWTRRGFHLWVQRVFTNPYWRNPSLNDAQIKLTYPDGTYESYTLGPYQAIQFPKGIYYVQIRYKENKKWEPWKSPTESYELVSPGDLPKKKPRYAKKPIKVKRLKEPVKKPRVKKKRKKKRKKKAKKKVRKVGRERPPKKWWDRTVRVIEKYRPEVTDPKALAGWLWYHGMKKVTKAKILKAVKKVG